MCRYIDICAVWREGCLAPRTLCSAGTGVMTVEQDLWSHSSRAAEDETRSDFHMIAGVALHRYTADTGQ